MSDDTPVPIETSIKQYNKTRTPNYKANTCIIKGVINTITYTALDILQVKLLNNENTFQYDSNLYFNPFMDNFLQPDKEIIFVCINLQEPFKYLIIDMYTSTSKTIKSAIAGLGKNIVDDHIEDCFNDDLYEVILFSNTLKHKRLCIDKKLTIELKINYLVEYTFYCEEDNILENWYRIKELKIEH